MNDVIVEFYNYVNVKLPRGRYVTVLAQSPALKSTWHTGQQTEKMVQDWTLWQRV